MSVQTVALLIDARVCSQSSHVCSMITFLYLHAFKVKFYGVFDLRSISTYCIKKGTHKSDELDSTGMSKL